MKRILAIATLFGLVGCQQSSETTAVHFPAPKRVVDMGAAVTEDLPARFWGERPLKELGFDRGNSFEDVEAFEPVYFVDSYYTLFNHGGPHVDAPKHMGSPENKGLDQFPLSVFMGRVRIIDVSDLEQGSTIPLSRIREAGVEPAEIALVYTGYQPPTQADEYPVYSVLSEDAANYLAELPVRAFATDALGCDSLTEFGRKAGQGETEYRILLPIHHAFLTRDILAYEQLNNVDQLLGETNVFFVGVPLNIVGGNGMIVRPVAFVY